LESSVASEEGLLGIVELVQMFESAEESSYEARKLSERDRDYHDNIQLTAEEKKVLRKRGQPEYIDNRIKTKIDYLVGLEKQQRINPRALPRTPMHEDDADSASQALNYVADKEQFDYKRSAIWRNLLIEGAGGMSVSVEPGYNGEVCIRLRRVPWDRMFWDAHSSEVDFSDAGYLGTVTWMDYDDALALYKDNPEAADILDSTLKEWTGSNTYDDKPKWNVWADKKRKRVRIVAIWIKRAEEWFFAEFTKGGILKAGPSPYVDDEGKSDCELLFQSAYVDRENNRYGLVREFISPQDAINKRSSKSLHALNTAQIVTNQVAVQGQDIEKLRREAAKPDGVIVLNGNADVAGFKFETRMDLAQGQVMLLQEAKQSIDLKGPNATQMGEKAMGPSAASGKAIIASQQGGMISLGDLLDNLRHLDKRVFRAIWNRIRQFWTAEKWLRVTDDEQNVKWVGINVDPFAAQQAIARNPAMAEKISGIVGSIAQLDCDIIIDEAPDSVTPALEQWQSLVELAKAGVQIPPDVLVSAAPNLKNKGRLLEKMKGKPDPLAQHMQQLQVRGATAEVQKTEAEAIKTMAEAQNIGAGEQPEDPRPAMMENAVRLQEGQIKLAQTEAKGRAEQIKAGLDIEGKHLDNIGKRLDIQRQRETPPPQPSQAA
jgi:hypothetical protein